MMKLLYSSLAEELARGSTRAALGLLGFRNDSFREHLRTLLQGFPGTENAFLSDPVFEATFGWKAANKTFGGLSGSLLHPDLVHAMRNPHKSLEKDYVFPARRRPYMHQMEAWRALIQETPPRSVLVSSGTGSGKTECFLIPILNDLVEAFSEQQRPLTGVRALFLYPLNALIKSQRDRLIAWSEPFRGRIRFCLYNGDTPEEARIEWKSEVPDRKKLRADPPPILVTNATMLEYMLVRNEDKPIIDHSQGRLRWIVLDEAHTYIGSHAAEITLLLRRVLHAFGCSPDEVHFIATSATIPGGEEQTQEGLRRFLADIAGVSPEKVTLVFGEREVPILPKIGDSHSDIHFGDIEQLNEMKPEELYDVFAGNPRAREVRASLSMQADSLSSLTKILTRKNTEQHRRLTLMLLDHFTRAADEKGTRFLPLRGHYFERALNGIWACASADCPGREDTHLNNEDWSFGKVFFERRTRCDACGCPAFEIAQCGECGAVYLAAQEVMDDAAERLEPYCYQKDEDEFQQELEPLEEDPEDPEDDSLTPSDELTAFQRLLVGPESGNPVYLAPDGRLAWDGQSGFLVNLSCPDENGNLACPSCKTANRSGTLFRPVRVGAPFLLQTAIPVLLHHLPPFGGQQAPLPFDGRRLLGFTDSRQGTARFAAKLQLETERNYVRSVLYHTVADRARPGQPDVVENKRKELNALVEAAKTNPVLEDMVRQKQEELKQLESPPLGRLKWGEAVDRLLTDDGFKRWLIPPLQNQTFGFNERQLAELCLWREFLFRPKRQFSLEGLGLLCLYYPLIEGVEHVPPVAAQRGVTLEQWRSLVQVAMDFQIRGKMSVAIPRDSLRWLGYPGSPTYVIAPGEVKSQRNQQNWPTTRSSATRRARLVQLIAFAEELDPEDGKDRAVIEEMLIALWAAVAPFLSATETGRHLEVAKQAEIMQVRQAWICPVTRRLLPVVYKDTTPYLPFSPSEELAKCRKVGMPALERPFWLESRPGEKREWLEKNDRIVCLRQSGVWTDLNDRIAGFSRYFSSAEHSAQIPGAILAERERKFKSGKLNLLSCSTTMELGVDIGGLTAVTMNNVPPHPANFLQRAGRAGRRSEAASISFTLCKSTPHGEAVFGNTLWAFRARLAVPSVSLESGTIVQRHLNALALSAFLTLHQSESIRKLSCGWFFENSVDEGSPPCKKFRHWCRYEAAKDEHLNAGMKSLTQRTILSGRPLSQLLNNTADMIDQTANDWLKECRSLLDNLDIVSTPEGNSKAEKAIGFQLERIRKEYLLGELATRGFLPGYGFPSGVVCLVTTTAEEIERRRQQVGAHREDNRFVRAGYPSRELPIAIRDYAPGTDTVLDGRVYRSGGVTLNWRIPAEAEGPPEIQSLRWVWRCGTCGGNGTQNVRPPICPHCGEREDNRLTRYEYIEPSGFAVDIRWSPHNDITVPQYIPVRDPLISMEGADWLAAPTPQLGRYRANKSGTIFHRTDGLYGEGFALCLRCGRADSMLPDGRLPRTFADEKGNPVAHKRLRGGRENDQEFECPGSREPWAVKRHLRIGASLQTEILELQLNDYGGRPLDRVTAYSLSIALRRAIARWIGIEEKEIGALVVPSRDGSGRSVFSMCLYDKAQGGAGYVSQALPRLVDILHSARGVLECPRKCDKACQACLLDYDTQFHLEDIDRKSALDLLDEKYLEAFALPEDLKVFGGSTLLEMEPLVLALNRELQRMDADEVRVYVGGDGQNWEPFQWPLRNELIRLHDAGYAVKMIMSEKSLNGLDPPQRDEIAAVTAFCSAEIRISSESPRIGEQGQLYKILEIGGKTRSVGWAVNDGDACSPSDHWGTGEKGAQFVIGRFKSPLRKLPVKWSEMAPGDLRKPEADLFSITIRDDFDGSLNRFGEIAWQTICEKVNDLRTRMERGPKLELIRYTDRYLKSPLVTKLLEELLTALYDFSGGISPKTDLNIVTSKFDRIPNRKPKFIHHDWNNASDRKMVFQYLFRRIGNINFQEKMKKDLTHARILKLQWEDRVMTIRLDQGFGYWHAGKETERFPFEKEPKKQIEHLNSLDINVFGQSNTFPTFWYIDHKGIT